MELGIGLLVALAVAVAGLAVLTGVVIANARLTPPAPGSAGTIVGAVGVVKEAQGTRGQVLVEGARWQAVSRSQLETGMRVRVLSLDGLVVAVQPEHEALDQGGGRPPRP